MLFLCKDLPDKIVLKRFEKFGYFMYNKPDWLYIWLISEKWRNLETPFACRVIHCYVLLEEKCKEVSVERRIYHLYSLVYKIGITRSSIGYINRMSWRSLTLVWRKSSQSQVLVICNWVLTLFRLTNLNVVKWRSLYFRDEGGVVRTYEYSPVRKGTWEFL